jgi:phosphoribosylglycinamide formyltransferase-1
MKKIVLFASGNGTNAENIMNYFSQPVEGKVVAVFSNNEQAKVLDRASKFEVPTIIFSKEQFHSEAILTKLLEINPDLIVLAGFLWKFPLHIITHFPNKVINIHPALLPKYGGKGMYGMHVHRAVLANKEKESGITIHYVNEHYDEGEFIFQKAVNIADCKTADEIAHKIHELEQQFFPSVILQVLNSKL